MNLPQLVQSSAGWLAWSGLSFAVLTGIAFAARWGLRFRLVGVTSFTLLLAVSSWAFTVSYTPPVVIEGAVRAPVVFDNGNDLVIAQAQLGWTTQRSTRPWTNWQATFDQAAVAARWSRSVSVSCARPVKGSANPSFWARERSTTRAFQPACRDEQHCPAA